MTLIDIRDLSERIMCPNSVGPPRHSAHQLASRALDAIFTGRADENGELPTGVDGAYADVDTRVGDRMYLYAHQVALPRGTAGSSDWRMLVTYWWHCKTCGLVLPGTFTEPTGNPRW